MVGMVWQPSADIKERSNLVSFMNAHGIGSFKELQERSQREPQWFWNAVLDKVLFAQPYRTVFDDSKGAAFTRWCVDGKTNAILSCLDQHIGSEVWTKDLLIWEGEDGAVERYTYQRINAEVSRLAEGLRSLDVRPGEVVAIYLPNVPEAFIAFYAIVKIGAIALPLFSGFGPVALADRLSHSNAVAVLTADASRRRGTLVPMKDNVDEAAMSAPKLRHVVTVNRYFMNGTARSSRDVDYKTLLQKMPEQSETTIVAADAPMMIMYTSGTSGRPKGTVHTHCGFPAKMALDLGLMLDLKASDRMLWISDMGWLVGPIAAVSTAMHGATYVMVEGGPDYPDAGRMWRLIEQYKISYLGVAPTTIRSLARLGHDEVNRYDLSSIRICVSTGETWSPEAWNWTFDNVCRREAPILNWSGGTEVGGGILAGTVLHPTKPCAFTTAIPGMHADIVDELGNSVEKGRLGELVLRGPSIGLSQGLWNDDRYFESYWSTFSGMWRQGDWAMMDDDGCWFIHGRSDDTLKIAGKRTGPSEIENCLASTQKIFEAAVVGVPDPIKGQAIWCVVIPRENVSADAELERQLSDAIVDRLGVPFRPQAIIFVADLPRTRNLKIMRRVVRAVSLGEDPGDLTALVNPEVLETIRHAVSLKVESLRQAARLKR